VGGEGTVGARRRTGQASGHDAVLDGIAKDGPVASALGSVRVADARQFPELEVDQVVDQPLALLTIAIAVVRLAGE
jgi:hypothetical protein